MLKKKAKTQSKMTREEKIKKVLHFQYEESMDMEVEELRIAVQRGNEKGVKPTHEWTDAELEEVIKENESEEEC